MKHKAQRTLYKEYVLWQRKCGTHSSKTHDSNFSKVTRIYVSNIYIIIYLDFTLLWFIILLICIKILVLTRKNKVIKKNRVIWLIKLIFGFRNFQAKPFDTFLYYFEKPSHSPQKIVDMPFFHKAHLLNSHFPLVSDTFILRHKNGKKNSWWDFRMSGKMKVF